MEYAFADMCAMTAMSMPSLAEKISAESKPTADPKVQVRALLLICSFFATNIYIYIHIYIERCVCMTAPPAGMAEDTSSKRRGPSMDIQHSFAQSAGVGSANSTLAFAGLPAAFGKCAACSTQTWRRWESNGLRLAASKPRSIWNLQRWLDMLSDRKPCTCNGASWRRSQHWSPKPSMHSWRSCSTTSGERGCALTRAMPP